MSQLGELVKFIDFLTLDTHRNSGGFNIKSKKKDKSKKIGYIHNNSQGVSADLQKKALQAEGCDYMYCCSLCNFDFEKKELVKAVKHAEKIKEGCLVVFGLEQLADSFKNLSDILKVIRKFKIPLITIKEIIITSVYSNDSNAIVKSNKKVGYVHASNQDSSSALQKKVLQRDGCSKIYFGSSDGVDTERKELVKAVKYAEKTGADYLVVCNIEKLACSLENLSDVCSVLTKLNIPVICIENDIIIKKNTPINTIDSGREEQNSEVGKPENEEIKLALSKSKEKQSILIDRVHKRRVLLFLIRIIIFTVLIFGTLGWIYYRALTTYDKEEISESEYQLLNNPIKQ